MDEAIKQGKREDELKRITGFLDASDKSDGSVKSLLTRTLLMAGDLKRAFNMTKGARSVGWSSYGSDAGVVFGAVLSLLAGHSEKAVTINTLLRDYADGISIYSERFLIDEDSPRSFYPEIIKGLKKKSDTKTVAAEYFPWALRIGKRRIEHIVSNKHRRAYGRAAKVLGSLAEAYLTMGKKAQAVKILHTYYTEKYSRFSAFRREVKAVVMGSDMLRNCGFLE